MPELQLRPTPNHSAAPPHPPFSFAPLIALSDTQTLFEAGGEFAMLCCIRVFSQPDPAPGTSRKLVHTPRCSSNIYTPGCPSSIFNNSYPSSHRIPTTGTKMFCTYGTDRECVFTGWIEPQF